MYAHLNIVQKYVLQSVKIQLNCCKKKVGGTAGTDVGSERNMSNTDPASATHMLGANGKCQKS